MIKKIIQSIIGLFYKRYFVSFVEECIFNLDYAGYIGGRIEVFDKQDKYNKFLGYATMELRFFTNMDEFYKFRDKYDFKELTDKQFEKMRNIVETKYLKKTT